jgi:hypothetical protein
MGDTAVQRFRLNHYKRQLALAVAERRRQDAAFEAALGEGRR